MKRIIIVSGLALLLAVGAVKAMSLTPDELKAFLGQSEQLTEEPLGAANMTGDAFDLIGTRTGTSTPVGVEFYTFPVSSSTYPVMLDQSATGGAFTITPTVASSVAVAYFAVLGSNDRECDTATTSSPTLNRIIKRDIIWWDASPFIVNLAGNTSDRGGTTTIPYTGITPYKSKIIALENLNARCLSLEVSASSTVLWAQFKQNSR